MAISSVRLSLRQHPSNAFAITGRAVPDLLKACLFPVVILLTIQSGNGALNDPFPMGYSMLNFGTVLQGTGISGRQPWLPACFAKDSALFSLSSAYINYYDAMDNLTEQDFRQAAVGFWIKAERISIKVSGTFFNALGIYEEQKGFLSAGTVIGRYIHISTELEAYRVGLIADKNESETLAALGVSLRVPWSFASATLTCKNITVENASQPGFRQPFSLSLGIHTMPHRFGAQGVVITVEPEYHNDIQLCIGQEFYIHNMVGLNFALSSKPLMVSFGISFSLPMYGVYTGFVHHPVLGWSQGVGMEYVKRKKAE